MPFEALGLVRGETIHQLLAQQEREECAEHVTADSGIGFVEDGPRRISLRIPMIATTCSDASRYLFRLIATRGKAPLGSSADLSVRVYCQAAVKAVPVVNRRDPSANREVP